MTPKGVRMINNDVVQPGYSLVVTERDAERWPRENPDKFKQLPDGTLYINPTTGMMLTKVEGETEWIPAGIRNDGTIVISKDTSLHVEVFTVTSVDPDENGNFTYKNSKGEQRYKPKTEQGFMFQLEEGNYTPGRNHLSVVFDDVLERSPSSGGIIELDETRFLVTENIPVGTELTVKYIQWVRIGNPYPRIFQNEAQYIHYEPTTDTTAKRYKVYYADDKGTPLASQPAHGSNIESLHYYEKTWDPEAAEVGDYFMDLLGRFDGYDDLLDQDPEDFYLPWANITGKPNTIQGYGITDNISYVGHVHTSADIVDLNSKLQTINTNIAQINSRLDSLTSSVNSLANRVQTLESTVNAIPKIYVQAGTPTGAPNQSIWVNTTGNQEHIAVLLSGTWRKIGAVWK